MINLLREKLGDQVTVWHDSGNCLTGDSVTGELFAVDDTGVVVKLSGGALEATPWASIFSLDLK